MGRQSAIRQPRFLEELDPEGIEMWEMIGKMEAEMSGITPQKDPNFKNEMIPIHLDLFKLEVYHLRTELRKMINNSLRVIKNMDILLANIQTKEEYIKTEVKTVKLIHTNLVSRLTKVLDGEPAFEKDFSIEPEAPRPYEANQSQ